METPFGMWIDERRGLLIISGLALTVGGAYAMYRFRTGDFAASQMGHLASSMPHLTVGRLDVDVNVVRFVPSRRALDLSASAKSNWRAVSTKVDLSYSMLDGKIIDTKAAASIIFPLKHGNLSAGGAGLSGKGASYRLGFSNSNRDLNLAASVTAEPQPGGLKLGAAVDLTNVLGGSP